MKRTLRVLGWIVLATVLGVLIARWPQAVRLGILACIGVLLSYLINKRILPKFSIRAILLLLGFIGCYLAFAKHGAPWQKVHSFMGHVPNIAMSPDGSFVAASQGTSIEIRETRTGKHLNTLKMPAAEAVGKTGTLWFYEFAFSNDNATLLTAGWRDKVHLYDCKTGKSLRSWPATSLPRISQSQLRFTGSVANKETPNATCVYGVDQDEPLLTLPAELSRDSRNGNLSASGKYFFFARDNNVEIWNVDANKRALVVPAAPKRSFLTLISVSQDDQRIVVPIKGGIAIWDIANGKKLGEWLPKGFDHIGSLKWSPDSQRLVATYIEMIGPSTPVAAAATKRNAIHHCFLLDNNANEISEIVGNSAAFTPSGDRIATVYGSCNILDGKTGSLITRIGGSNPNESSLVNSQSLIFSPDGNWLFTNGSAAVFKRTRSERWYSVLRIPAYWGTIVFFTCLVREAVGQFFRRRTAETNAAPDRENAVG